MDRCTARLQVVGPLANCPVQSLADFVPASGAMQTSSTVSAAGAYSLASRSMGQVRRASQPNLACVA